MTAHKASLPEVPNILTLLDKTFGDSPFVNSLHAWEALFFTSLVGGLILLLFWSAGKNITLIPSPRQNFIEWGMELIEQNVVQVLGEEGKKYIPFLGTLFLYILMMNWLVLIPFMKAPSSNLNTTVALALIVFGRVQYLNFKNRGFFGFLYYLAGSPKDLMGWLLAPLLFPIEVLTEITRPLTLALRLFGNIFGEDVLIGIFALFGVTLLSDWPITLVLPLQIPFLFLALFTGLMQAFVFSLLTTVYILLSIPSKEGH